MDMTVVLEKEKGGKKELNGDSTLSICCWSVPDKAVISCWFSILSYIQDNKMKIGSLKIVLVHISFLKVGRRALP